MRVTLVMALLTLSCGHDADGTTSVASPLCTPACDGKQCGPDGCGGECGACADGWDCVVDRCAFGCGDISIVGCCYGEYRLMCYSSPPELDISDCPKLGKYCGWVPGIDGYGCVAEPTEDPSGQHPRECDFTCTPKCADKQCGADACGGECGHCPSGSTCFSGKCCEPKCEGRDCGPDLCGGVCGTDCQPGGWCDEEWKCHDGFGCIASPGVPGCKGCACAACVCEMDDRCCSKEWDETCAWECKEKCGGCLPCATDCDGKECGPDGCGGTCGECGPGTTCKFFACVSDPADGGEGAEAEDSGPPDPGVLDDTTSADAPPAGDDGLGPSDPGPVEAGGDDDPGTGEAVTFDAGRGSAGCGPAPSGGSPGVGAWLLAALGMAGLGGTRCGRARRR